MWYIHGRTDQYERGLVEMRVASRAGWMKVELMPELYGEMKIGCDWPPLYDVLNEVKRQS